MEIGDMHSMQHFREMEIGDMHLTWSPKDFDADEYYLCTEEVDEEHLGACEMCGLSDDCTKTDVVVKIRRIVERTNFCMHEYYEFYLYGPLCETCINPQVEIEKTFLMHLKEFLRQSQSDPNKRCNTLKLPEIIEVWENVIEERENPVILKPAK